MKVVLFCGGLGLRIHAMAKIWSRMIDEGQLLGYRHTGFWRTMDTFKDKQALDELCACGRAPWEVWKGDRT